MLLSLWLGGALGAAGPPPCEPIQAPERSLAGEHFWIEWDAPVGDPVVAQQTLDWAEAARQTYIDLGWPFTDRTILIRLTESDSGSGGLATTSTCPDGAIVPLLTLFAMSLGDPGRNITMHEVGHAAEYGYMGAYLDAVTSWPWWLEGTAVWLATKADGDLDEWADDAENYLATPHLGLHQTPFAYTNPEQSRFLYGTGLIVQYLEDQAGPEAVRATWAYGGTVSGTPIWFPDAIAAAGLDWDVFWTGFMASVTVLDLPEANEFFEGPRLEQRVNSLPASGEPGPKTRPQGMGLGLIQFKRTTGAPGRDLVVSFDGDPAVPWMAVLVRTTGQAPGGEVLEVVPIEVGADGHGEAELVDFDGSADGWLVVSPQDATLEPRDYAWSAALNELPGEGPKGCGCAHGSGGPGAGALLALALLRRRRGARR